MKKQLLIILSILLPITANADSNGTCGENLTWTYAEATKTLTISGYGGMSFNSSAPWSSIKEKIVNVIIKEGVNSIGSKAFYICRNLTSITIPSSVNSIGEYAFYHCDRLASMTIPNGVTSIGNYTFSHCSGLTSISLPNSVTSIGNYAFCFCDNLTSVTLPNRVTSIGNYAFYGCTRLASISIGIGVKEIGERAFSDCMKLSSLVLPESLTIMGEEVFFNCPLLEELFYLSPTSPKNWIATTRTYVPDERAYTSPFFSGNNAEVLEMITFNSYNQKIEYSGYPPALDWTNNVSGYTASLSFEAINSNVGEHEEWIPVKFTKGGKTITAKVVCRYTIEPAELTAKAANISREYGEENPQFNVVYSGFLGKDDEYVLSTKPIIYTTADKTSCVGEYPLIICGGSAPNYTITCESGILTVRKAPLRAKVKDETREYGHYNSSFTVSYSGLKNDETEPEWEDVLTIETSATKSSDVGTYAITASGVPVNYDLSQIKEGTLTITPAPLTIKANDATRQYFEEEPDFSYTCFGFLNDDDKDVLLIEPTFATQAIKTSDAGMYPITPSGAKAKNYAISHEQGVLTVSKRSLNVTSNGSREYGEENPTLPIEYDGFVNNETEDVLTKKPEATTTATEESRVGAYPITISGGEATNYDFVYKPGVLTITKAPLSAKVNDATKVYGEQNPDFSLTYEGLKIGDIVPTWTTKPAFQTEATKASGVGQYAVKAVNGVAENYNLEVMDGILSITPAPLTIKANNATRMYYEAEPTFDYTCIGLVNDDNEQALTTPPSLTTDATRTSSVGSYTISPSGAEAKNYTLSYEQGTLTITKRSLNVTSNGSREYGEENPTLSIEYDGFVNNETESVLAEKPVATANATKSSAVGEYPITVSGGNATNYDFDYKPGVLTVIKAPLSAKVNDATKVYGAQNPDFSLAYEGLKNGETAPSWTRRPTFQTAATISSGVGRYEVAAKDGVPQNYDLGEITSGTLSVTPAPLTIRANDATRLYYSDEPTFSYRCSGFVNGDNESVLDSKPSLSTVATLQSSVGTYDIKVGETSCPNYSISYVDGTLTITPRTLTASVGNYERPYNEENPEFKVDYEGFMGNDNEEVLLSKPVAQTSATKTTDVGTYRIDVAGGKADNYTFSYVSGLLTINQAEQSILWDQDLTILGVGDQVELKAEATSGLPVTYTIEDDAIVEIYYAGNKLYLDCKAMGETRIMAVQEGNKNYYPSTRVRKNIVVWEESSVNSPEDPALQVCRTTNGIRLIGVRTGNVIQVATADGVVLYSMVAESQTVDISLTKGGMYIIKVGAKTFKLKI